MGLPRHAILQSRGLKTPHTEVTPRKRPGSGPIAFDFGPAVTSARVSGTVRDAAGAAPLSTITVELYSPLGRLLGTATSDLAGHYVIRDPNSFATPFTIAPGSYYLRTRNNRGYVDEVYPDASASTAISASARRSWSGRPM